jgi:glutamate N-acetyltransferase/amino-acid N-acetyltransferase
MRYKDRPDLALISADASQGAVASGVFTLNRFTAAPVDVCRAHLKSHTAKAVIVNAGIANACTGDEGLRLARETARITAEALNAPHDSVLVASTGVIGRQISIEPIAGAMDALVGSLRADGWEDAARAIMTTDLQPKLASVKIDLGGVEVTVGGIAKGSGMIAPNMATLLVFVCTDAAIDSAVLDHWVRSGAGRSFNAITVDGDTSTNDTLLVLASGAAGNPVLAEVDSAESRAFGEALEAVLVDLAKQVVMDGEGATKFIEILVTGAPDTESARSVAFTVANSPLVKTAFFGQDANWGRIVAAAGRSGVPLNPERTTLFFGPLCAFRAGAPVEGQEVEEEAARIFKQREIRVHLDLGMGNAEFTAFTCDLSYDYIKINASYRT